MGGATSKASACACIAVWASISWLYGCGTEADLGGAPACDADAFEAVATAEALGTRLLSPDAPGMALRLTQPSFVEVELERTDACVQVVEMKDDVGTTWIELDGPDTFCRSCPRRTALLRGGGLFGIPEDAGELGAFVDVRLGLRSCATLGKAEAELGAITARIARRPRGNEGVPGDARGVIRLDLATFGDGFLGAAGASGVARLLREVESFLADARLRVDLHALCELDADAITEEELAVQAGDTTAIEAAIGRVREQCRGFEPDANDPRITVLYVPCLRFEDAVFGTRASLAGYTTHIPGGFAPDGVADAVVIGGGCELPRGRDDGAPLGFSRDLAHELGHYLGLFHSVEADGETEDTLADTDGRDLMIARPSLALARGLMAAQVAVVRSHPAVRWPKGGEAECANPH
jgi:hypothetical protein